MKRKQILSILMASAMLVGMVGCGGGSSDSGEASTDSGEASTEESSGDDSSSGEKSKITICWRDDGTDIELNANYQQMQAAYETWDKKDQVELEFEDNAAVCVVLASDGYPVKYEKGFPITGLDEFKKHEGYYCFHAGTKFDGDQIVTNGGRVLGVTAKGKDLKEARANAYAATEWVQFDNKYMRHDIGKAIDEA